MSHFDISVVIPSYDEGRDIDRTLVRIAALTEKLSKRIKVAVFVVINNASGADKKVKQSNARTAQFLHELEIGKSGHAVKKRSKRDAKILRYLTSSRVDFIEIDLFRSGKSPEKCNVGIARGAGFRSASEKTKRGGVLIGTDADTLLGKNYLTQALKLRQEKRYGALTGPVKMYPEKVDMNDDREMVDLIEGLWLESIKSHHLDTIWNNPNKDYVPHIPGSNLVVQNRVFKAVGTFPEVSGAEDVLFGMHINMLGEGIDYDDEVAVYTSSRVSHRTPEGHGFGQMMDRKGRALYDIDAPYLSSEKFSIIIREIATFLILNGDCWMPKDKWIRRFNEVLERFKVVIDPDKMSRWYDMLSEFKEFDGAFFHPLVKAEVTQELEQKFPRVSLAYASEKVITDSPYLDASEKEHLRHSLAKARELKLGAFGVKFVLLYTKLVTKMKELGALIQQHEKMLKDCARIFDYELYFTSHQKLLNNMVCIVLKPYEVLLEFDHAWKAQLTAESTIGAVGKMKQLAEAHLIHIGSLHAAAALREIQNKIGEIDVMFPKLNFNVE